MTDDGKISRSCVATSRGRWLGEPSIADVLNDPIVRQVMSRDAVCLEDLARLMTSVRGRLT